MGFAPRHLLGLEGMPADDIVTLLDSAASFKEISERDIKKVPTLRGKTVINLFYENSTRTRTSFEIAAKRLSADTVNISGSTSSTSKGETLVDTARNLEAMRPDAIVLRHPMSGAPQLLARHVTCPIINAGDGCHEHPTQALLDLLTIRERRGDIAGLTVAIVGDLLHSRVGRSNLHALRTLGATVRLVGPPTLVPHEFRTLGAEIHTRLADGVRDADVIMMLRIQRERMGANYFPSLDEYSHYYCLTEDVVRLAKPQVIILHPGPMNRGLEISSAVADGPYSVIMNQVTNGVAVRMALLYLLVARSKAEQAEGEPGTEPATVRERQGGRGVTDRLRIANGTVVDPDAGTMTKGDVLIEDGRIVAVDAPELLEAGDANVYDARGCWVVPGFVDMHVHLREPGYEYKETLATGTAAAVAGGFTSVACMANTNPVNDSAAVTRFIIEQAAAAKSARVYPIGAVSVGLKGEQLAEIGEMRRAGIVAISDDGMPIMDAGLMRRALEYATLFDLLLIAHEEDACLRGCGVMNEGLTSVRLGLKGSPAAAEELMIARDVALVELTGGRLHVAHVSTARSVAMIRDARARGLAVSAEATPHHLTLTEEAVAEYDTNAKMAPPLRTQADVHALRAGLADGTIEAIATDHAPHHADEKDCEFDRAANGIVGLETALGLGLKLVADGVLDVPRLIARLTTGPAKLLGVSAGTLAAAAAADVAVIDPERRWKVAARAFRSKSRNTPFDGWDLTGKVVATFVGGALVYEDRPAAAPLRVAS